MKKILSMIIVLLVSTVALAQNKGRIVGTVNTFEEAVIPGVKVTIASDALIARTMTTTTNERGVYRFVLLPVGTFDIKFEKEGYKTIEQKGIILGFDETVTIDKVMEPSEFEDTITITGEAPIVDKTSSGISDKLDTGFLQNTPNTREVWSMPKLTAGYNDLSALGSVASAAHAYNIDGSNLSDPQYGFASFPVNMESIEQMDVAMFGSTAEYGSFTGSSLNLVTKSGSNEFHGEINYFAQRAGWVSDNTKNFEEYGITLPEAAKLDNPNMAIGGPLLSDKVWFFANFNHTKKTTPHLVIDGKIDEAYTTKSFFLKLSSRWDERNMTYLSWNWFDRLGTGISFTGPYLSNRISSLGQQGDYANAYLLHHSHIWSENLILEGRLAGFIGEIQLIPDGGWGVEHPFLFDALLGQHLPGSSLNWYQDSDNNRFDLLTTADYYIDDWNGRHSFKLGLEYERSVSSRLYSLEAVQMYIFGMSYMWINSGTWESSAIIQRLGAFIQDSWTVNENLTLNLGFRLDHSWMKAGHPETAPIGDEAFMSFNDPAYRLGFAYDLFGDGKTVIRGFVGRYYEGMLGGNTESLTADIPPTKTYFGQALFGPSAPLWVLWDESGGSGNFFIADDLGNHYTEGFMLGLERELMPNLATSISYVYKKDNNVLGVISPDASWDTANASFSNENGSYSGVYYPNFMAGIREILTNPKKGDVGVAQDPFIKWWGVILELNKRMSDNWSLKANYTYSRNTGNVTQNAMAIGGHISRSDPNSWINSGGRSMLDRPHVFKLTGTYIAPFDFFISPVVTYMSGFAYGKNLTIGGTEVLTKKVDGSDRFPSQFNVDLRLEKAFLFNERYRIGIILDVFNLLNDDTVNGYMSTNIDSDVFLTPASIVPPRIYQLGIRFMF